MTGIPVYSTTAASNINANTGITWDEGMSPGLVNNSARQNMADLRSAFNDLQWFQYGTGDTSTLSTSVVYNSSTSFKVKGVDVTTPFHAGRRVKAVGSTTGTIYGSISSSSFSTDTTVNVTWDSGSLSNETIAVYLSQTPVTGGAVPSGGVAGTTAADNPSAGRIGEFVTSTVTQGSPVSPASNTPTNLTSISLTAGDWDVEAQMQMVPGSSVTVTEIALGINTTTGTLPANELRAQSALSLTGAAQVFTVNASRQRINVSSTTTVYAVGRLIYSGGVNTASIYGFINARRVR